MALGGALSQVKASKAISLFLVERGMPGFSLGQRLKDKCGMRASPTAELVFNGVSVPAANLVGEEGGATLCMMRNLEIERVVLAAMAVGIGRRSLQAMNAYASERFAFGKPLRDFGQVCVWRMCVYVTLGQLASHPSSCRHGHLWASSGRAHEWLRNGAGTA